jgi:hypothetical protein
MCTCARARVCVRVRVKIWFVPCFDSLLFLHTVPECMSVMIMHLLPNSTESSFITIVL